MRKNKIKHNFLDSFISALSSKTDSYLKKFIKYLIYPAAIVLLSLILFLIFGFNNSFEFSLQKSATIDFRQTIEQSDYNEIIDQVSVVLEKNGFDKYEFSKLNSDNIKSGLKINVLDSEASIVDLESFKLQIETLVSDTLGYSDASISDFENVEVSTHHFALGMFLATVFFAAVAFIYAWIRIEIVSALSIFANISLSSILLTSIFALLRLPLSKSSVIAYVITLVLTTFISYYLFVKIKALQYENENKSILNSENIKSVVNNVFAPIFNICLILIGLLLVVAIPLMCIGNSVAFSLVAACLGVVLSFYTSFYIGLGIWNKLYNRAKNKRIQFYKDMQQRKQDKIAGKKVNEDKLVV